MATFAGELCFCCIIAQCWSFAFSAINRKWPEICEIRPKYRLTVFHKLPSRSTANEHISNLSYILWVITDPIQESNPQQSVLLTDNNHRPPPLPCPRFGQFSRFHGQPVTWSEKISFPDQYEWTMVASFPISERYNSLDISSLVTESGRNRDQIQGSQVNVYL